MEINIEDLTLKQIREIAALAGAGQQKPAPHPFVGKHVICRCHSAGVHGGILVSQNGNEAVLKDSRRLWQWTANAGVALSGLAVNGLKSGKIDTILPHIALTGVIETIPTSEKSRDSINNA